MKRSAFIIRIHVFQVTFLLSVILFVLVNNHVYAQQFNPEKKSIKTTWLNSLYIFERPFQFIDLDGDGDLDVFNNLYDRLRMSENIGDSLVPVFQIGKQSFYTDKIFNTTLVDIDSDGDFDIIGDKKGEMIWLENTGTKTNPLFNEVVELNVELSVYIQNRRFEDIDGDGDLDVFGVRPKNGVGIRDRYIVFQENIGTADAPKFSEVKFSPFNLPEFVSAASLAIEFIDIDNDGDLDAYFTETYNQKGKCYILENVGNSFEPQFAKPKTDFSGLINPFYIMAFADIDSDGQIEFVAASTSDGSCFFSGLYYQELISNEEE